MIILQEGQRFQVNTGELMIMLMKGRAIRPALFFGFDMVRILLVAELRFKRGDPVPHRSEFAFYTVAVKSFGFPPLERRV